MREDVGLGILLLLGVAAMVGVVLNEEPYPPRPQEPIEGYLIAMVGPRDLKTQRRVTQVLKTHGMGVIQWGIRVGSWVQLYDGDPLEAIQILRKDSKSHGYYIRFGSNHPFTFSRGAKSLWVHASYSEILKRPEFAPSTDVGACLRQPDVAESLGTYPTIDRIMYLRQPLFIYKGKGEGFIEELLVEQRPAVGTRKNRISHFQVFEGENEVHVVYHRIIEPR